jgi:hypothetical protein
MSGELDLRLRENKGKRLLPHFLEAASLSLGRPVTASDLVSLDETDEVFSRFLSAWHAAKGNPLTPLHLREFDEHAVRSAGEWLSEAMPGGPLYLFRAQSRWCGAIRSTVAEVCHHVVELTSRDDEDVMASSHDAGIGIGCQLFSSQVARTKEDLFELVAWWTA